jgi:hypothetical protein
MLPGCRVHRNLAIASFVGLLTAVAATAAVADGFYKRPALFSTRPGETKSLQTVGRFGPVGMAIELVQPAFQMKVGKIEEGSPAAATALKQGQYIASINGETLKDIDPRIQLGRILAEAEATDGKIKFIVKESADAAVEEVIVQIPVLGAYSDTWPLNCPKSDKIVRNFADYLAQPESDKGFADIGMLFLLSTGEEKDLAVVREWVHKLNNNSGYAWHIGYGGPALAEYYLRTGDPVALPKIQAMADRAVQGQYLDGWAGRGGVCSVTYGNGHLNAGGTGVVTFLMLAKECGADIPDHAFLGCLEHFYRYSGRGTNPYGDHRPERGFVDNGKNGLLAFAMSAAAGLTPDGEDSLYAKARDVCAIQSIYSTSFMLHGHTGGGIGEIWRSASMGLLREKRPDQYRDFMDSRQWHYDLSRRYDGSFGILGGAGYDKVPWGAAYALTYTVPRKTLRITGAPPTKFSKPYQLPKQAWGVEKDNDFLSLQAVPYPDGAVQDLTGETIAEDSSMPLLRKLHGEEPPSDDVLRKYVHHQDSNIRFVAASKVLGVNSGYIGWRAPGGEVRTELLNELLQSKSPRVRRSMFAALYETFRREGKTELLTRDLFDLVIAAIEDPTESWWVKDAALHIVAHAPADWVVPHVDSILPYLEHKEWWLRNAALVALSSVIADERCYERVIPAVGDLIRTNQRSAVTLGMEWSLREKIKQGSPAVQELAKEALTESYTDYAGIQIAPTGQNISSTYDSHLKYIAQSLAELPGGLDALYEIARDRYPNEPLPYKEYFLAADPSQFGPKLKAAITPIIMDELIPEFVGKNRKTLRKLETMEEQNSQPGGERDAIDQLASLYDRAGHDEYNWRMFADFRTAEWDYHTFDPIPAEQVPFDRLICRFRPVTLPNGMENWYATDFDAAKAGWKRGQAPFGNYNGKLPQPPVSKCSASCDGVHQLCTGATPVNTFWDKEVLLLRKTVKLPPIKPGHRYRLRVNHALHVGNGTGFAVYLGGKKLVERDQCIGRGGGEKAYGGFITTEFLPEIDNREVTIAVQAFLRYNDKYKTKPTTKVPQGRISVHLEEMKLPPMADDLVYKSAAVVPMTSAKWQAMQDPDDQELMQNAVMYRWDGKFEPNANVVGSWTAVATVASEEEFDPAENMRLHRAPFNSITLESNGRTDRELHLWTGDMLLNLDRYEALQMTGKTIAGEDYLFLETGGFNTRNGPDWKPPILVLKRK